MGKTVGNRFPLPSDLWLLTGTGDLLTPLDSEITQPSPESYSSNPTPTYTTPTYTTSTSYSSTASTSGGNCNSPNDVDSRGYRCGGRAASVRSGGGEEDAAAKRALSRKT